MTDGLKTKHRDAIVAALAANERVERAVLFGSRAVGTNTVTSDVDIALFGQQLTLTDQANLAAICDELPMAQSVDLVLHSTIDNLALVEHIRTCGVEWYRRIGAGSNTSGLRLAELVGSVSTWHRIKDIAKVKQGRYISPDKLSEVETKDISVPVWGANGVIGYTKEVTYENPQPLVTCRGNGCGLVQWSQNRANVSNNVMAILPLEEDEYSSRYLYYTLLANDFSDVITGSAQPQITIGHLNTKEILWHSNKNIRKAIAYILSMLDNKIELNRQVNKTLEAMARAIFKDWFVDFGPVRTKMKGYNPYLSPEIWGLFPDSFEDSDSELGKIPRGWVACSIGTLLALEKHSITPGDTPDEVFSHYSIPAFDDGMFPVKESGKIIKSNKYLIRDGVFLVSKLNPRTPRIWLPSANGVHKKICSTEFLVCRPNSLIGVPFGYYLVKSGSIVQRMSDLASGTSNSHQRVRPEDFTCISTVCPDDKLLLLFNQQVSPLLHKSLQIREETLLIEQYRDMILPKLLSGEVSVRKAEKAMEVVTT